MQTHPKYNIDKCFGPAARFRVPLSRATAFFAAICLKNADRCLRRSADVKVQTEKIRVKNGSIRVHIIAPKDSAGQKPGLLYLHGGGFLFDAAPHQYKNAAAYAVKTGSVVVFPRYRLTPKVSAPVPLEDCATAWEWTLAHACSYQIDPEQLGIGGDSAGAYLAARLTNRIIAAQGTVCCQMLIYPVIDAAMRTASMQKYPDTPMWNAKSNKLMWQWYDSGKEGKPSLLDEALPRGIPPTYVETAEFDCLHDEGLLYAERLKKTGADVTVYETHGTMHGFDCVRCEITEKALESRVRFVRRQLAPKKAQP